MVISFNASTFFTFRRKTYIAQELPEKYLDKIQEFLSYNTELRNKNRYELDAMTNMDENHIYLNMPPSTTV